MCNFQPGKFTGWDSEGVNHGRSHYGDLFRERIDAWLWKLSFVRPAVFKHRRSDNYCDSFRERIHGFGSYRLFVSLCLNMGGVIKKKG